MEIYANVCKCMQMYVNVCAVAIVIPCTLQYQKFIRRMMKTILVFANQNAFYFSS